MKEVRELLTAVVGGNNVVTAKVERSERNIEMMDLPGYVVKVPEI